MSTGLNIKKDGALDFLSLGALVHRLDPGIIPFRKATHCDIHVSGGEFNVSANLSDCFRLKTGVASAMVDYPIGDLIAERVRAMGVQPFYKRFKHDGVRGPNMATVYSDRGQGVRAPVVFYNRSNEAAGQLKPGDFDWGRIFAGGVRWFHTGGIFAGLSETTPRLALEAVRAARRHGVLHRCVQLRLEFLQLLRLARCEVVLLAEVACKIVNLIRPISATHQLPVADPQRRACGGLERRPFHGL